MHALQLFMNGDIQPQTLIWENNQLATANYIDLKQRMAKKCDEFMTFNDDSGSELICRPIDVVFVKLLDIKHNTEFNIEMKLIEARANARLQTALQSDSIININKRFTQG